MVNCSTQSNTCSLPFCHFKVQRKSSAVIVLCIHHSQSRDVRAMLIQKYAIKHVINFDKGGLLGRVFFGFIFIRLTDWKDIDVMEATAICLIGY